MKRLASDYFNNKPTLINIRPNINMYGCRICESYYKEDIYKDCIINHCKNELLKKTELLLSLQLNTVDKSINKCTDQCFYNYYYDNKDYKECVYNNCQEELEESYKNYLFTNADFLSSKKNTCSYCYDMVEKDANCFIVNCKSEIVEKNALFTEAPERNDFISCTDCWCYSNEDYIDCVNMFCQERILQKALSLAITTPSVITSTKDMKSHTCKECVSLSLLYGQKYGNDCILLNCKEEAINKEVLFAESPKENSLVNCDACYNYNDKNEYENCVKFYCKSTIIEKVNSLYKLVMRFPYSFCEDDCY